MKRTNKTTPLITFVLGLAIFHPFTLSAKEIPPSHTPEAICAVLMSYEGWVRILDRSRAHLIEPTSQAALPCGSWISIEEGWAEIKHEKGANLSLGPHTFMQLSSTVDDQFALYRGQIYVHVGNGSDELRAVSEVGRARIRNSDAIFLANGAEEATQLIALKQGKSSPSVSLENRFLKGSEVILHPGETSTLYFKLQRVVPSFPQAIDINALKTLLETLQIPDQLQTDALEISLNRVKRNVLAEKKGDLPDHPKKAVAPESSKKSHSKEAKTSLNSKKDRKIASIIPPDKGTPAEKADSANKPLTDQASASGPENKTIGNPEVEPEVALDAPLRKHLIEKITGGAPVKANILHPTDFYGKSQKIEIEVEDSETVLIPEKFRIKRPTRPLAKHQVAEKRRVMRELLGIHAE